MTIIFADESGRQLPFDAQRIAQDVMNAVLNAQGCPYEAEVNLLLTTNQGICAVNKDTREIDSPTDVLSFPALEFEKAGDFTIVEDQQLMFHPETGELLLGDILVSVDKVYSQAEEYGHSLMREYAFLIAHSMLHLCGYDHMKPQDAALMEKEQEEILESLGITRD